MFKENNTCKTVLYSFDTRKY